MAVHLNIERHLAWMRLRNLRPETIKRRRQVLLALAAFAGGSAAMATAADLADWQASLRVGPDTRANYVSHLSEFYGWLVAEGIRDDNPAARLVRPRLGRRLPRPIATDDLLLAVKMAPGRIRPWLVLAAWGGLRCVEIALLRRENVIDNAAEPHIIVALGATKGHDERVVPMPRGQTLYNELVPMLPRRGWVFPRADGQPGPNSPQRISSVGCEYLRSIGLADTMHSLRHWFGTTTYQATRDSRAVQELLGHRSLRSTEIYTKISSQSKTAAVEALPQL